MKAKKIFSIVLTLVMVFSLAMVAPQTVEAAKKAAVKSVKVTNAKKSGKKQVVTVAEGEKVKLKVKVKVKPSTKKNKKVTYKVKNAKIATVSKKGVVTGVKEGQTKLTVKSKVNPKKKTTIVVKVTKKEEQKQDTTPQVTAVGIKSVEIMNSTTLDYSNRFIVTLSSAKELTKDDFKIQMKSHYAGNYIRDVEISSIKTTDNITYLIRTKDYVDSGNYYLVTADKLDGTKSQELFYKPVPKTDKIYIFAEKGEEVHNTLYLSDMLGYVKLEITSGTLPEGIQLKNDTIQGVAKTLADHQKVEVTATDEFGNKNIITLVFVFYDDENILVEDINITAEDEFYYNPGTKWFGTEVYGGSGYYRATLSNDYDGLFDVYVDEEWLEVYTYDELPAGTYTLDVNIEDDEGHTAVCKVSIVVLPSFEVKVTGVKYQEAEYISFLSKDGTKEFVCEGYYAEEDSEYAIYYVPTGVYDIVIWDVDYNQTYLQEDVAINAATTINITDTKLYTISGTLNNELDNGTSEYRVELIKNGEWVDSYHLYNQESYEFFLITNGTYKMIVSVYDIVSDDYTAIYTTPEFVVSNADTKQDITFEIEATNQLEVQDDYELESPGQIDIVTENDYVFCKFVPENTGLFEIYTTGQYDTVGVLLDEEGNVLDYNDDDNYSDDENFYIGAELEGGKTYYIAVREYDNYSDCDVVLNVVAME